MEFVVDGKLLGSSDIENRSVWPNIYTRRAGLMCNTTASLINGGQCKKMAQNYRPGPPYTLGDQCESWDVLSNVTIRGSGTIDGNGNCGWVNDKEYSRDRPTLLGLGHISYLFLRDLLLTNPPFWTTHILFSENVHVRNVHIDTASPDNVDNADGIDPDSSKNVLIEDCFISSNDDVIAIKSGINEDGRAVGIPSSNITVRNMYFESGHGLSIGSETSGGINDVFITDIQLNGTDRGVRIKSQAGRGK
jgi:polygalacturonase